MTADERDPILDRLSEVDPAKGAEPGDEALVRANVKRRAELQLAPPDPPRRFRRTGLLVTGAAALTTTALVIVFAGGGDGLAPGPERALAIEKGPNGVTLTIEDAGASADEMNDELEAAGIDGVRVFSVPGSPNHAGTWAGSIDLAARCAGAPSVLGSGIRIPYHVLDAPPAPGHGFIHVGLPQGPTGSDQAVTATVALQSGSGKRAIVSTRTEDGSTYAPAVLIAIRSRLESDGPDAKTFGVDDLAALGGDFEPYAQALEDGRASCDELGLGPPGPSAQIPSSLLRDGPVVDRCVVKVLGTPLFSIDGDVSGGEARRIHACSERFARTAARKRAEIRARKEGQVDQIDSEADLPAFVRARLDPNRSTQRAPHGGVKPDKRGIDTGEVVLTNYDGHDHRTAPKRPGEYVNLLCAARGGEDREFYATTFLHGEPIANARISCPAHGPWRSSLVVKLGDPGVYEVHLNGAGFDDFVIRTRSTPTSGPHPNIVRPAHHG
jgi:hypothetical protein